MNKEALKDFIKYLKKSSETITTIILEHEDELFWSESFDFTIDEISFYNGFGYVHYEIVDFFERGHRSTVLYYTDKNNKHVEFIKSPA